MTTPQASLQNSLPHESEHHKRATLRRMKRIATSCVVAAFGIRIGAQFLGDAAWVGYLKAMSEAAVVGGLADWFAATALFRHPLGWKIPHTRIIPNNQNRISRSLATFVSTHFLSKDVLAQQCEKLQPSLAIAGMVDKHREQIAASIIGVLPRFLELLDHEKIDTLLRKSILEKLGGLEIAPLAGNLLDSLTQGNRSQAWVNELLDALSEGVAENRDVIIEMVRKELPVPEQFAGLPLLGLMKNAVADKIGEAAVQRLLATVEEIRDDETHRMRVRLQERIASIATSLREDESWQTKLATWRDEWLASADTERRLAEFLTSMKQMLKQEVLESHTRLHQVITDVLQHTSQRFINDQELCQRGDTVIRPMLVNVVSASAPALEMIIRETVQRWDGEELSDKIELEVGRDLQFVRLNGTLVGAILGVLLHGLLSLF